MKNITIHDGKEIIYEENFWSGKKEVTINGEKLKKSGNKSFILGDATYNIKGNFLTGVKLTSNTESYVLVRNLTVLEYVLCFLPLVLILIGGAIGGALGAIAGISNSILVRKIESTFLKILASLGIAVAAFFLWYVIATVLLTAIS